LLLACQEELISQINSLEFLLADIAEQSDLVRREITEIEKEKNEEIEVNIFLVIIIIFQVKDQTIAEVRQRIEDMSIEFAEMMSNTLGMLKEQLGTKLLLPAEMISTPTATTTTTPALIRGDSVKPTMTAATLPAIEN
jgi:hypothetical protein